MLIGENELILEQPNIKNYLPNYEINLHTILIKTNLRLRF